MTLARRLDSCRAAPSAITAVPANAIAPPPDEQLAAQRPSEYADFPGSHDDRKQHHEDGRFHHRGSQDGAVPEHEVGREQQSADQRPRRIAPAHAPRVARIPQSKRQRNCQAPERRGRRADRAFPHEYRTDAGNEAPQRSAGAAALSGTSAFSRNLAMYKDAVTLVQPIGHRSKSNSPTGPGHGNSLAAYTRRRGLEP